MRLLKRWLYVGAYGPEVMACAADARIGPFRQRFWAVCEPGRPVVSGHGGVVMDGSRVSVEGRNVGMDLVVNEGGGVETRHADEVWTRKQAGVPVRGTISVQGRSYDVGCLGAVDETRGRHRRHTTWMWSAGGGFAVDGRRIGWNLVTGVNDEPSGSERCIWIDGAASEPGPVVFADDLSSVSFSEGGGLAFTSWGAREDRTNYLLIRSEYRQPFGTFTGTLPGGVELAEGYGVMEWHDVWW